ncbi:MAG TPA: DUF1254 domain-containing protein [Gemmatimonadaceae bacterium]
MTATATPRRVSPARAQSNDQTMHRRAIEAAIWGMPVVNFELMYEEMVRKLGGRFNQILFWSKLLDWKNQTLTPNPDVIYLMPFFDTSDVGPIVLEVPPADDGVFNGSVMDCWQAAIEDIGPGGVDRGNGGKYLILPPQYDAHGVPAGYIPLASDTYRGYALIRSILKSTSAQDVATAVAYARRLKLYPLSRADNPPTTTFVDASDVVFESAIPYDSRFYETLDHVVQVEPWLERDRAMIDQLKSIGIARGTQFNPPAATRRVLDSAILEAKDELDAAFDEIPPFYDDGQWVFPVTEELQKSVMSFFQSPDSYPVDTRGSLYTFAFFSARHAGKAQFYLMATRDSDGAPLDGSGTYRLTVPGNAPVSQYWSITVYDHATHTFVRNTSRVGRSSQTPNLTVEGDGSVELWLSPDAPADAAANWIQTNDGGEFELLARFYGPKPALFDKSWRLGDVERVAPAADG